MTTFRPFDATRYLDSEEAISLYLSEALADPDPNVFVIALGDVARARGMTDVAREAGLGRESLYKALSPGAKLRFETVHKLMHALGVKLVATPGG